MVSTSARLLCFFIAAAIHFDGAQSAKILCFFPTASRSHVLGTQALMKNLASRGHEVTMVSAFPLSKPVKNYHDIYVPIEDAFGEVMASFMQGGSRNMIKFMPTILRASLDYNNFTLNSPQFRRLVEEKQHFDVAVVGWFMNDFVLGIGSLFNCPTILYFSAGPGGLNNLVGNPTEVASVPHLFLGNKNPMKFLDRVKNTLITTVDSVLVEYFKYRMKVYYDHNFPAEKQFPSYNEARLNVSLVMLNSYFTQTIPRPYVPNMVEVGGLQIKAKPDPLPSDLQEWLDGAEHGAIFLSFGSNLKSSNLRQDKFDAIIGSISKLKQRIIWKWDTDVMPGKPANVFIGKWLPQDAILAHPNLKLFVTHGGLGSITESMYHGVPVVGIPMFADQDTNVAQVVRDGWGVAVPFDELTEPLLTSAIREVLENAQYAERIERFATLYKDRPQTAMDLATFWVEYVVRHKGAPHLHYQGADLNFLQRNLIDVFAFLGVMVCLVFKTSAFLLRHLKRKICDGRRGNAADKQKTS
ncbi:UDP-glucosyltransferase 2-like [Toxorhynchites rutilus septentrionalis]|uniref:UDP-glucosyltransferase 2-like n=1 Tax=Toxorhynchites rutilus septentrionalis TaxID=329112 RepID=UPI0024784855|nr:UDP-glucosyltransferase 2-like [Toxorhynchites rutilus septentrionalis]XP_055629660.1 UDP-glucosyltransferase 2-like [Toxorhynchites rutilus septentrionalis]